MYPDEVEHAARIQRGQSGEWVEVVLIRPEGRREGVDNPDVELNHLVDIVGGPGLTLNA